MRKTPQELAISMNSCPITRGSFYRHKKTNDIYTIVDLSFDCKTNDIMVIYSLEDTVSDPSLSLALSQYRFVREQQSFLKAFEKVKKVSLYLSKEETHKYLDDGMVVRELSSN